MSAFKFYKLAISKRLHVIVQVLARFGDSTMMEVLFLQLTFKREIKLSANHDSNQAFDWLYFIFRSDKKAN